MWLKIDNLVTNYVLATIYHNGDTISHIFSPQMEKCYIKDLFQNLEPAICIEWLIWTHLVEKFVVSHAES